KVVRVKPKIVVSLTYQNIQGSPTYNSGFAMRFPRITHYRPDYHLKDIATLDDIKIEVKRAQKGMSHLG
ncbi:MAG: DNA ligase, partial [Nanoarchaeota archaeon]|nr:DNA ligase [Nanoarchaeota archaeon]